MDIIPNWLIPWFVAALAIWPLVQVERWIHRHVQGLGLLLTNNPQAAVLIYYMALLPGVVLHEVSQWVLARLLRVRVKQFRLWPQEQRGGVIRLGLVEIEKGTDDLRATLIGMVPLVSGVGAIVLIGSHFNLQALLDALPTGDLPTIGAALDAFFSTPDFWLWVYLVFAIANAMLPEEHDRINWWLFVGAAGAITVVLLALDLSILLQAWLEGPLAQVARWLSFALVAALAIDLFMMALIALAEAIFSRLLGRELEYH